MYFYTDDIISFFFVFFFLIHSLSRSLSLSLARSHSRVLPILAVSVAFNIYMYIIVLNILFYQ